MTNEVRQKAMNDILTERERQVVLAHGGDTEAFDKSNDMNDWVSYLVAYAGRASAKVFRNQREAQGFRENMVKTAAIALAAIESYDKGYLRA